MKLVALLAVFGCAMTTPVSAAPVPLPGGGNVDKVDFERHVMGLLSKSGCNAGSCHGSFQGKNGFRLSLFGFEPDFDFASITRDTLGRRVNVQTPDDSLLLLKAAGRTPHEGGMRFAKGSWMYDTFRAWIAAGATHTPGSGAIKAMTVTPGDFAVLANDKSLQLKVSATFADGSVEDITPFCDFKITDDAIADVSATGRLTPNQPGDAGLSVLYRGTVRALRVLVPSPAATGFEYPDIAATNAIDREIFAKLKLLNMVPSEASGDLEFLRRVTIDVVGILPTPDEARAFLADSSKDKRAKKIDELLKHPLHAALWATKLSDVTGNNTLALEQPQQTANRRSQMWHDWLRKRVADNVPYDQMVRDILTATTADGRPADEWIAAAGKLDAELVFTRPDPKAKPKPGEDPADGFDTGYEAKKTLDLFWRRQQRVPVEAWGEKVAAAFLGVRLECAQCHKHPTDRWTQDDYWGFANLFAPVNFVNNQFSSPDVKKAADAENKRRKDDAGMVKNNNQIVQLREMFFATTAAGTTRLPKLQPIPMTTRVVDPKALGGPELPHELGTDTRARLFAWMADAKNPFFAHSFVNRVWAHYFGVGLVNPVDDFSQANPPTNAPLLDLLAKQFVDSGYDLRALERAILTTRTYQLSSKTNDTNKFDKVNFAHGYIRPLMAEQVVDVLNSGIGTQETFGTDAPAGKKMTEVGSSRLANANLNYVLRIFGRPPRTTACDCERASEAALPQTLYRMTDPAIEQKLADRTNRIAQIVKDKLSDEKAVEELFLGTLTRLPTASEKASALKHLSDAKTPRDKLEALKVTLWALINTREFILNH
jgi:hypothetical protein